MDNVIYFHPKTTKPAQNISTKAARTSLRHGFQQFLADAAEFLVNEFFPCRRSFFSFRLRMRRTGAEGSPISGQTPPNPSQQETSS
ncbi:MAG: hypothetical protein SPL21_04330 [Fibrobacter sp.]|nr:hypothetical protein [Fibrobacter sp.]